MTDLLYRIFEISIQASVLTLVVLVLRILFKKAPKSWRCALWGLVALRLLLPFSLQSPVSLQPDTAPMRSSMEAYFSAAEEAIPNTPNGEDAFAAPSIPNTPKGEAEQIAPSIPAVSQTEQHTSAAPSFFARIELPQILMFVWLSGIALLLIYAGISYLLLRRKTAAALRLKDNVFLIDEIPSPFVLGVLRPRICLSDALPEAQREHVIAHEQAHIRRGDHVLKPLAFLLASVYWFNPVLWLGYVLFSRDLELACDERVIRGYAPAQRAAYAETLLTCGRAKRSAALSPLAFGEVGVKTRVKQALSYKKPALWILVAAVLAAVVAAVCFLTEPKTGEPAQIAFSKETVPLFSSFSPEKISDDYKVLDVTEQYVLASISPIFEGANTDLVGSMYPNRTSRTALVSIQTGEIVCEWDLRDEDLRCYAGAITDDGVILNCLKADKTYSAQSLQYQLRKYAFDQKAVILDEGSCVSLGSAERISKDQYLYGLRFRTEESQKLCLREMNLNTGKYESYEFDLPEGDILDENIRYENGAYLYSVMRLGGKNNLFYYAAKGKAPHLIRFSEEEQPLECTLLNGRILAQTHEKASDRPGYYTWLYVYNTKGVLLNKIKYDEAQQHPRRLTYLCSGSGFCLTVSSQVDGYQEIYAVMPIVIEKDKPVCLDCLGYGAYAQFVDGGDFVLAYNVKDHTCESYRLQKIKTGDGTKTVEIRLTTDLSDLSDIPVGAETVSLVFADEKTAVLVSSFGIIVYSFDGGTLARIPFESLKELGISFIEAKVSSDGKQLYFSNPGETRQTYRWALPAKKIKTDENGNARQTVYIESLIPVTVFKPRFTLHPLKEISALTEVEQLSADLSFNNSWYDTHYVVSDKTLTFVRTVSTHLDSTELVRIDRATGNVQVCRIAK